jgi:hypothetical protein
MAKTIERTLQQAGQTTPGVGQARAELMRRFGAMGGVTARAIDLALVMPNYTRDEVERALMELAEAGLVEIGRLADGTAIFHFPRR